MHEIDKEKFGRFLVQLRKERSMTQKDLAERLYVSDKAVSKWERGLSLPDISLLQPLSELLGVSVTELLSGQFIPSDQPMTVKEVEPLLTGALSMTAQEQEAQRAHRRQWLPWYLGAAVLWAAELWAVRGTGWLWDDLCVSIWLPSAMAACFGAYYCFFAKEKLPAFYDQNKINFYSDGALRMNLPGVYFNNRNWPHILRACRTWACVTMAVWTALCCAARMVLEPLGAPFLWLAMLALTLLGIFGSLFIPVYAAGRKYG